MDIVISNHRVSVEKPTTKQQQQQHRNKHTHTHIEKKTFPYIHLLCSVEDPLKKKGITIKSISNSV